MVLRLALALPGLLVASSLASQAALADASTFGIGSPGIGGSVRLEGTAPVLGTPFNLGVDRAPAGIIGVWHFSVGVLDQFHPLPLPIGTETYLYLDPLTLIVSNLFAVGATGQAQASFPVPVVPALVGGVLGAEAVLLDLNPPGALLTSNAVELAIGLQPIPALPFHVETIPLTGPLLAQVMNSPQVIAFGAGLTANGYGTLSFGEALELRFDPLPSSSIPADARFAMVPVADAAGVRAFLLFTNGTHPMQGFIEGVDVFTLDSTSPTGSTIRIFTNPALTESLNIQLAPSGAVAAVSQTGTSSYTQCVGICFAALVAAATVSGISAGCQAACAACFVPPHASCVVCGTCALGMLAYTIGCWWGC